MADKNNSGTKSSVGNDVVLPSALPRKAKTATPATGVNKGQSLRRDTRDTLVSNISDLRSETNVISALRKLSEDDGATSTAIYTAAAISQTPIKLTAFNTNTVDFNPEATRIAQWILASMDTLHDYTKKFRDKQTLRQFIEAALHDIPKTGGLGCELVLNENRLPDSLQLVSYGDIEYQSDGKGGRLPVQKVRGSDDIDLNIANFWISEMSRDPTKAYATPMLKAAVNESILNHEFVNDMHRVVERNGHSRLIVTLDSLKVANSAPEEVRSDPEKLLTYMESYQTTMAESFSQLSPEDSIVVYDNCDTDVADIGGSKSDYVPLMQTLNNRQATSLKTPPSMLGMRSEGSQSLSNVESLTYLKQLEALRGPITDVISRAFTLAVRLYGQDVYVRATFDSINLRPEDELEAHKTMKQTRQLQLLSYGIWSDEYYCHMSGNPYHQNMPQLSGTNFFTGSTETGSVDNTNGAESTLSPDTPSKAGGESQ